MPGRRERGPGVLLPGGRHPRLHRARDFTSAPNSSCATRTACHQRPPGRRCCCQASSSGARSSGGTRRRPDRGRRLASARRRPRARGHRALGHRGARARRFVTGRAAASRADGVRSPPASGPNRRRLLLGALGAASLRLGAAALGSWQAPIPPWAWLNHSPRSPTSLTPAQREFIDDVGRVARERRARSGCRRRWSSPWRSTRAPGARVRSPATRATTSASRRSSAAARSARSRKTPRKSSTVAWCDARALPRLPLARRERGRSGPVPARERSLRAAVVERRRPTGAARVLLDAGYATDPAWADKLARLIDELDLERLDA